MIVNPGEKHKIITLAQLITNELKENGSLFINIQIEEEMSQYDVFFSYGYKNIGFHQRGLSSTDLIIGVAGFGMFGFYTKRYDTEPEYYTEKLGIHSEFLSALFNEVRKNL